MTELRSPEARTDQRDKVIE